MQSYAIKSRLQPRGADELFAPPYLIVAATSEREKLQDVLDEVDDRFEDPANVHDTRALSGPGHLILLFAIPSREAAGYRKFTCIARREGLLFLDDSGLAASIVARMARERQWKAPGVGRALFDFLEALLEFDEPYMQALESRLVQLEEAVMAGKPRDLQARMGALRRELLHLQHHYQQLYNLGRRLYDNENDLWQKGELALWRRFLDHVTRLSDNTQLLREQSLQLQELFQAHVSIQQNRTMGLLTIVTIISLPLTLVVGWYGMNFKNMPELSSPYGYPAVIAFALAVLIAGVWVLRHKKFF